MLKRFKYIIFLAFFPGVFLLMGQSFSIFSVFKYGDHLTKDQYKKIHKAEWHKQEAGKYSVQAEKVEKEIRIYERDIRAGDTKAEAKKEKSLVKKYNLDLKAYGHLKESNQLFYAVYNEKIVVLWDKYESDDKAIVILKAMEDQGHNLMKGASQARAEINKKESLQNKHGQLATACKMEEKGLDMIASALEGYYNYELELKRKQEAGTQGTNGNKKGTDKTVKPTNGKTVELNQGLDVEIVYVPDNKGIAEHKAPSPTLLHESPDGAQEIVISRDALMIYHDNEEIVDLILKNYDLDNLEPPVSYTTLGQLREKLRIAENDIDFKQDGEPVKKTMPDENIADVGHTVSSNDLGQQFDDKPFLKPVKTESSPEDPKREPVSDYSDIPIKETQAGLPLTEKTAEMHETRSNDVKKPISESEENNNLQTSQAISPKNENNQLVTNDTHNLGHPLPTTKKSAGKAEKKPGTGINDSGKETLHETGTFDIKPSDIAAADIQDNSGNEIYARANTHEVNTGTLPGVPGAQTLYTIQIAADKRPLSAQKLQSIYKGTLKVEEHFDNGWYKYTIGAYLTPAEAEQKQKDIGLKGAFIVANHNQIVKVPNLTINELIAGHIEYRVQVAASRAPMDKDELKRRYTGKMPVKMTFEDNWYKYTIEGGADYAQARSMALESGVRDAFVAIYVNGERVDLLTPLYRILSTK